MNIEKNIVNSPGDKRKSIPNLSINTKSETIKRIETDQSVSTTSFSSSIIGDQEVQEKRPVKLRVNSRVYAPLIIMFNFFVRIFRLKRYNFDEQKAILAFVFFVFCFALICIPIVAICFVVLKTLPAIIGSIFICAGLFSVLAVFFLLPRIQVFLFLFNSVTFLSMSLVIYYECWPFGVFMGAPVGTLSTSILFSIVFGNYFQIWFWLVLVILNMIASFVKDMVFTDLKDFYDVKGRDQKNAVVFLTYFSIFLPVIGFSFVTFQQKMMNKNINKIVESLGEGILTLNFENRKIRKFLEKEKRFCSKFEVLLKSIISNLVIYKEYLPDSIKNSKDDSSDECYDEKDPLLGESSKTISTITTTSTNSLSTSSNSTVSGSSTGKGSSSSSSFNKKRRRKKKKRVVSRERKIDYGLKRKEIVIVLFAINNFNLIADEKVENVWKGFLETISSVVHKERGIISETLSEKVFVTFNAVKKSTNSEQKACDVAYSIGDIMKRRYKVEIRASIMCLNVLTGNIQSSALSKFCIFSKHFETMLRIDAVNQSMESGILISEGIVEYVKYKYKLKKVDMIKIGKGSMMLNKIVGKKIMTENENKQEWIYQIKSDLKNSESVSHFYDESWKNLREKKFESAQDCVNMYLKLNPRDVEAINLSKKIKDKEIHRDECK